jgi:hypothetical protein
MPARTIQDVLQEHAQRWMAIPGVTGAAIGASEGRPCIIIFVCQKTEDLMAVLPEQIEGHRVVVEESGAFRAL